MKPVLVLQHLTHDGPAYLRTWLEREGHSFEVRNTEAGDDYPSSIRPYAALAVLGGEMSANDPLPSLRHAERLIAEAMDAGIPVLGHCLGGQLLARSMGARIAASPVPEIGWHRIELRPGEATAAWFGNHREVDVFQWHYEAFELPAGAHWLAQSEACPCQAFSLGHHLAMQFHIELDAHKLHAWTAAQDDSRWAAGQRLPTVQNASEMCRDFTRRLGAQQRLADRLYSNWWAGVES